MHNIDRTLMETDPEAEYGPEYESDYEYDQFETPDTEAVFDEADEMELAAELLGVTNEAELEQFLGGLVGAFVKTAAGKVVKRIAKAAGKKLLPTVVGALVGGPVGAVVSSQLTSEAGRVFGLELEGLSPEDQEFETAKHYVRWVAEAAKNAALMPPSVVSLK